VSEIGRLAGQRVRKRRAETLVQMAAASGKVLGSADKAEQDSRDEAFRNIKNGGPNPDKWADR
jgi:salicylate hydroxylase